MAGSLLHITLANLVLEEASIPASVKDEITASIHDYRLGAVLADLPFFENVLGNGFRLLLRRELRLNEWGHRLHERSPTGLCRELFKGAETPTDRALALGALTHLAIDTLFHQDIERRVTEMADGTPGTNTLHKHVEDQMDFHVHCRLIRHPGVGRPYARDMFDLKPSCEWSARFSEAVVAVHGTTPSPERLSRWLRGMILFGRLQVSSRFPWVETRYGDNPELRKVALALAEQSIELSKQYLEIGWADLAGDHGGEMVLAEIPEKNLVNGGDALPTLRK